ncbi:hypothetical protein LXA43DRAFT_892025, partial [Ganoderma leucocontextum]
VLNRIKGEVVWTAALSRTDAGQALEQAILVCSRSPRLSNDGELESLTFTVLDAMHCQARDDDIREVEARWWGTAPLPEDGERIMLEFRDVTPEHKSYIVNEVWPPETVECAPSEPFENAAQRFRVQANKKHRHPFWPSRHFGAILGTEQVLLDKVGTRTVAEILHDLSEERVVPYVRNDEDNHTEGVQSPARYFQLWDRTLPKWCVTPEHWVEPTPPPGFVELPDTPPALKEQYYKKVPTLHISGRGRRIIPSATKPQLIAHSVFIPVENSTPTLMYTAHLAHDADLVPYGEHLTPGPGKIALEDARALLGRVVQSSTEPRPDPNAAPPAKRPKVMINKFVAQSLGIAWGVEMDSNGWPAWLHCVTYNSGGLDEYVLNLRGDRGRYKEDESPLAVRQTECSWIGVVMLPVDRRALRASPTSGSEKHPLSFHDWDERTKKWTRDLNNNKFAPVVEVGADGTFVGGDLEQSKGEHDQFEVEITGAKPGIWLMSVDAIVRFVWESDGTVNYGALPRATAFRTAAQAAGPDDGAEWEVVDNFGVDSGQVCLFSKHALDQLLATGTNREGMLESLSDQVEEFEGRKALVPAGVVGKDSR